MCRFILRYILIGAWIALVFYTDSTDLRFEWHIFRTQRSPGTHRTTAGKDGQFCPLPPPPPTTTDTVSGGHGRLSIRPHPPFPAGHTDVYLGARLSGRTTNPRSRQTLSIGRSSAPRHSLDGHGRYTTTLSNSAVWLATHGSRSRSSQFKFGVQPPQKDVEFVLSCMP